MTEPRTAAGRALLQASERATNKSRIRPVLEHEVLAIEAEARAESEATVAALRRLVGRAHRHLVMRGVPTEGEATYLALMDDLLTTLAATPEVQR